MQCPCRRPLPGKGGEHGAARRKSFEQRGLRICGASYDQLQIIGLARDGFGTSAASRRIVHRREKLELRWLCYIVTWKMLTPDCDLWLKSRDYGCWIFQLDRQRVDCVHKTCSEI